jgi:hypothetical protein
MCGLDLFEGTIHTLRGGIRSITSTQNQDISDLARVPKEHSSNKCQKL